LTADDFVVLEEGTPQPIVDYRGDSIAPIRGRAG
jgi:hypothetical protein